MLVYYKVEGNVEGDKLEDQIKYYKGEQYLRDIDNYFEFCYESSRLTIEFARAMIKDIDGFDVKNGETLQSDIFGILPPTRLGVGVKAVLK